MFKDTRRHGAVDFKYGPHKWSWLDKVAELLMLDILHGIHDNHTILSEKKFAEGVFALFAATGLTIFTIAAVAGCGAVLSPVIAIAGGIALTAAICMDVAPKNTTKLINRVKEEITGGEVAL